MPEHPVVVPSGDACGAEVHGVDLSRPVADTVMGTIRAALFEHGMLAFRHQALDPRAQVALTARFGEPDLYTLSEYRHPDFPEVLIVSNVREGERNIGLADAGTTWHTDSSYLAEPPLVTLLHAKEVPVRDGIALGDTLFTSAAAAYAALPQTTKSRIDGLSAEHSYAGKHRARARLGRSERNPPRGREREALRPVTHPVVRTHPVTGRRALYVAEGECVAVPGLPEPEALALIAELAAHLVREEFQHRHRWRVGDLVVWDNAQLQHLAIKDYALPQRRLLHRTQTTGGAPF